MHLADVGVNPGFWPLCFVLLVVAGAAVLAEMFGLLDEPRR